MELDLVSFFMKELEDFVADYKDREFLAKRFAEHARDFRNMP